MKNFIKYLFLIALILFVVKVEAKSYDNSTEVKKESWLQKSKGESKYSDNSIAEKNKSWLNKTNDDSKNLDDSIGFDDNVDDTSAAPINFLIPLAIFFGAVLGIKKLK